MTTVTYSVPNISCGHCVHTITTELKELAGIEEVKASLDSKQVVVRFEAPATSQAIETLLTQINYPVAK